MRFLDLDKFDLDGDLMSVLQNITAPDFIPIEITRDYLECQWRSDGYLELTPEEHWNNGGWWSLTCWEVEDQGSQWKIRLGLTGSVDESYQAIRRDDGVRGEYIKLGVQRFSLPKRMLSDATNELFAEKARFGNEMSLFVVPAENFRFQFRLAAPWVNTQHGERYRLLCVGPRPQENSSVVLTGWELSTPGRRPSEPVAAAPQRRNLGVDLTKLYTAAAPAVEAEVEELEVYTHVEAEAADEPAAV